MAEIVSPPPTIDIKDFNLVLLEIFSANEIVPFYKILIFKVPSRPVPENCF